MFTVLCRHGILIDTDAFVIGESNIMETWKYVDVLNIKENTISNIFTIYT